MTEIISHSAAFRRRRFLNWFPLGLTYAFLYMGRYNLTVAKNSLGELMTKEDFGFIFGVGTTVYAFAFLFNGPLVDRIGGRKGMLIGALGSAVANLLMGLYLYDVMSSANAADAPLRLVFSVLYGLNMYFQSYGAVSIVKVNAHWFHVGERGGFSGIFGTMISSGIFLAFTVNKWILDWSSGWFDGPAQFVVFLAPAILLTGMFAFEFGWLRDSPSDAGFDNFDTGDASSGEDDTPVPTLVLFKRILTNPIILTVAAIEFCTGVLRNGVMHWFPIYAKEVWVLEPTHLLMYGSWEHVWLIGVMFVVAAISGFLASKAKGNVRAALIVGGALAFLAPFLQGGWGGLLFVAGVIGGNVAGWVSQLFFQSRRGPAAGGLYFLLTACTVAMWFTLAPSTSTVQSAGDESGLLPGDEIVSVSGTATAGWSDVGRAVACTEPISCVDSTWDSVDCVCSTSKGAPPQGEGVIAVTLLRQGKELSVHLPDPKPTQRAGDKRKLDARPVIPMSPYLLGTLVFFMSLAVIGTHGLLSGTATMDFGGRKGAATTVGIIDGFVYLGTAIQSFALGKLTTLDWGYWPLFLIPFGIVGSLLTLRIWHAKPGKKGGH